MRSRLASIVKYVASQGGHGNSSLTNERAMRAMQNQDLRAEEAFLERYPYVQNGLEILDVVARGKKSNISFDTGLQTGALVFGRKFAREHERLHPNYVIRKDKLEEDLHKLLVALGCPNAYDNVESRNVHSLNGGKDDGKDGEGGESGTRGEEWMGGGERTAERSGGEIGSNEDMEAVPLSWGNARYMALATAADAENAGGLELARSLSLQATTRKRG